MNPITRKSVSKLVMRVIPVVSLIFGLFKSLLFLVFLANSFGQKYFLVRKTFLWLTQTLKKYSRKKRSSRARNEKRFGLVSNINTVLTFKKCKNL